MNLTRTARSPLADPRRDLASVLAAVLLVLSVLSVQVLCGIHLDEAGHSTHADGEITGNDTAAAVITPDRSTEMVSGGHGAGEGPVHCSEDRAETVRHVKPLSLYPELAEAPNLTLRWPVPDLSRQASPMPSGVTAMAAPSLHALGISRT
ncbi:hypothetical protein [Myceligenerans cantabricum]